MPDRNSLSDSKRRSLLKGLSVGVATVPGIMVATAGGHGALGTRYGDWTLAFALPRGN